MAAVLAQMAFEVAPLQAARSIVNEPLIDSIRLSLYEATGCSDGFLAWRGLYADGLLDVVAFGCEAPGVGCALGVSDSVVVDEAEVL